MGNCSWWGGRAPGLRCVVLLVLLNALLASLTLDLWRRPPPPPPPDTAAALPPVAAAAVPAAAAAPAATADAGRAHAGRATAAPPGVGGEAATQAAANPPVERPWQRNQGGQVRRSAQPKGGIGQQKKGPPPAFVYKAQYWQDEALEKLFFQGRKDGVFVEVGAGDGTFGSNSLYFEETHGWTGLCVEPLSTHVAEIRRTRKCRVVHAAVCGISKGAQTFLHVDGVQGRSGLTATLPESYTKEIALFSKVGRARAKEERIPCINLNELLLREGIHHVDLLAIDVEGAEFDILSNLRLGRGAEGLEVSAFLIEVAPGQHALKVRSWMREQGYSDPWRIDSQHPDDIFLRRDLLPPALAAYRQGVVVACSERCRCPVPCPRESWTAGTVACSETLWAETLGGQPSPGDGAAVVTCSVAGAPGGG